MNKIYLRNNETIKSDVEVLYNSAFPENERPPFFWFYNIFKNTKDNHIVGYYEENQFIGFVQYVIYLDCVYISYLAVSSSLRNQGYGTRILNDIRQSFPDYTILLCFEEVEPKYVDYHSRCNRQAFYKRNGYIDNGLKKEMLYINLLIMANIALIFPLMKSYSILFMDRVHVNVI